MGKDPPHAAEEDAADKQMLINRMGTAISEQSARVLGWFAE